MTQLIVRDLDTDVQARLAAHAARHSHTIEEEARDILRDAVQEDSDEGLGTRIANRFRGIGLTDDEAIVELRGQPARPARFDE